VAGWVFCMDGYHAQLRQINPPYADKRLLEKLFHRSLAAEPFLGEHLEVLHIDSSGVIHIRAAAEVIG